MTEGSYEALSPQTLSARLGAIDAVANRLGGDPSSWTVREVGDGNPAFDVTPNHLVTALITERSICEASKAALAERFPEEARGAA